MSKCLYNDHGKNQCEREFVPNDTFERGYCPEHGCCICGGVMLADTEDWKVQLCESCLAGKLMYCIPRGLTEKEIIRLIDAAYDAGVRSQCWGGG